MKNRKQGFRKLGGLLIAVFLYYVLHEGAHLVYALALGTFKQINIIGLGIQIETYRERMSDVQTAVFCIAGAAATAVAGWILVMSAGRIVKSRSLAFRAAVFYVTLVFLLNDPFYLSVLYPYVGGGDMNGIRLLVPELYAKGFFFLIFLLHMAVIARYLYPVYTKAYQTSKEGGA